MARELKPVNLTTQDFLNLKNMLESIGYTEISIPANSPYNRNFYRRVHRHFSQKFPETGFAFHRSGMRYKSIIWTSYIKELGKFRDTGLDAFQSIIVDTFTDKLAYCAEPYKRNAKNVILRVARRAWVNKHKIVNLHICSECQRPMAIRQKFETNQVYFICRYYKDHTEKKFLFHDWDFNLPPKARDFAEEERIPRAKYRAKNKKKGITPTLRRKKRRVWIKHPKPKRE